MAGTRIVGICLVRNEENFVAWSLLNIADFCDEIIVLDNKSTDRTPEILAAISRRFDHVRVIRVEDAYDTHKYVEPYAGEDCWVFGVDGDEIYDPSGLSRLRPHVLQGRFNEWWRISAHAHHVVGVDWNTQTAVGYGQPESVPILKLFNFSAISSWHQGRHERLHGKAMKFRPGYSREKVHCVWKEESWDNSDFRCLHMCFVPRSSLDDAANGRPNPSELMKAKAVLRRIGDFLGVPRLDSGRTHTYKQRYYARGPQRAVDISAFKRPSDCADLNPKAGAVEELLVGALAKLPRPNLPDLGSALLPPDEYQGHWHTEVRRLDPTS